MRDGKRGLVRLPDLDLFDDQAGKPVGIHQHIGRRPIAAFGNSDGDLEMLEWVSRPAQGHASGLSFTTTMPHASSRTTVHLS